MAAETITEAISVGAPAYNAGDIALCAEIYQVAAASLLRDYGTELLPQVARDLKLALQSGNPRGSDDDSLAWAFRRAFDMQLKSGARGALRTQGQSQNVSDVVASAIATGAPAYNRGDVLGCARVYEATANSLLDRDDLDSSARAAVTEALQQCAGLRDVNDIAWALRRALDTVADSVGKSGRVGQAVRVSVPAREARTDASNGKLVHDFASGAGLDVRPTLVNDTVMGGRSNSSIRESSDGLVFEGTVTKRGGGGFASIRFSPTDRTELVRALATGTGVSVTTRKGRGGSVWKFQLMDGYDGVQWQADFVASENGGAQQIPFSSLRPTWRGQSRGSPGLTADALESVRSFGFMMSFLSADGSSNAGFQDGPFELVISRVEVY